MKVIESNRTVDASEAFETVEFDMTKEARAHIFNVLRNQLYSDKILAVMREYSTNGVDAHVEVGKGDLPIVITLPNQMTPTFKVRDFGKGLSEKDVKEIYSKYGESTKRGTNKAIGQLGLGCKSAFCYSDNFLIISFQDGTCTTYNAFIDPSNVGCIAKMHSAPTDEDNGIEIQIPVAEGDIREFKHKAEEFFPYFKVTPVFRGTEVSIEKETVIFEGKGWRMYGDNYTTAVAVMGSIGYPLSQSAIKWTDDDRDAQAMLKQNIQIDFEIGDLEIAASREGLQYTDHTQDSIKKRLKAILADIVATLSKDFDGCKTVYEAKILYAKLYDYSAPLYRMRHLFQHKKLQVNGVEITNDNFQIKYDQEGFTWRYYSHGRNGAMRVRPEQVQRMRCFEGSLIIVNDIGPSGVLNRIAPIIELDGTNKNNCLNKRYNNGVYLININDQTLWDAWVKESSFDAPTILLSTLDKVKLAEIYGSTGSGYVKNIKHGQKVFELDMGCTKGNYHRSKSDFFKAAEVDFDDDEGVYVVIDRFYVRHRDRDFNPADMIVEIKQTCKAIGETVPTIYAIKTAKVDKLGDGFITYEAWAKAKIQDVIANGGFEQAYVDIDHVQHTNSLRWMRRLEEASTRHNMALPSDLEDYKQAQKDMEHSKDADKINTLRELGSRYGTKIDGSKHKPTHDLNVLQTDLKTKYALLAHLENSDYFGWNWTNGNRGQAKATLDYLQMVDRCAKLDAAKAAIKTAKKP